MIKDSLGAVRYVEFMRPDEEQQQQQQEGETGGEGDEDAAEAAAEGGEGGGDAAARGEDGGEGGDDAAEAAADAEPATPSAAASEKASEEQQQQEEGGEEELRYMVRFQAPDAAAAALAAFDGQEAAADGSKLVAGLPATLRAVDGEEEEAYHKRVCGCRSITISQFVLCAACLTQRLRHLEDPTCDTRERNLTGHTAHPL
jgi:hypothetical protein